MHRYLAAPLALALTGLVAGAVPAAADNQGQVRLVYVSPDGPKVDFYMDGQVALNDTAYKTVSRYLPLTTGRHTLAVRTAGAAVTSAVLAQVDSLIDSNGFYTVVVGGKSGQLKAATFSDALNAPPAGQALARFIHTAPEVPGVDVALKAGRVLFTNISFLEASAYGTFPAGAYDLELKATGTDRVLFSVSGVNASAGTLQSLTAIGGVGQPIELLPIQDAATAANTPSGAANTGAGGMALRQMALVGLLCLLLLVGPALLGVRFVLAGQRA